MFDIIKYLESRGIEYHKEGEKNVSKGWVNINCPFPECTDSSWHCGINLKTSFFNCYICSNKGVPTNLIRHLENCSWSKAKEIVKSFSDDEIIFDDKHFIPDYSKRVMPTECSNTFLKKHTQYLINRGFSPRKLVKKYRLRSVGNIGFYKYRIIAPIIMGNKIVSFIAADITGQSDKKYRFCPNEQAVLPGSHIIYNYDNLGKRSLIVEGITDVWRIGGSCGALIRKQFSGQQIELLRQKKMDWLGIMLDADAIETSEKLASKLSGVVKEVEIIELAENDPDKMSVNDLNEIKKLIA